MSAEAKLCVIWNPAAARGRISARWRHLQHLLASQAVFWASTGPGDSERLAEKAASEGHATVVAAGGDGTVHEVANGLLRSGRRDVALGVIPLGSGNDYAASLRLPNSDAELCARLTAGPTSPVDVGCIEDEHGRVRHFVNTLGLGLSGAVVWEVQRIHGLKGLSLYGLGALRAIWRHFRSPDTELTLDDETLHVPTLFFTVALGRREGGGFVVAPQAELDDGLFDYLHGARLTRWQALRYLPRLALGRLPTNDPAVRQGRCRRVTLQAAEPLLIHVDGELFGSPEQPVTAIQVRLLPQALLVRGREASGPD